MSNNTNAAAAQYEYGPDAELDRDFESLTDKQRNVVEALVEHGTERSNEEVAAEAGVTPSYVYYVQDHFPHIISNRRSTSNHQPAADGGHSTVTVELTHEEARKAIRLLPEEMSETIFNQLR